MDWLGLVSAVGLGDGVEDMAETEVAIFVFVDHCTAAHGSCKQKDKKKVKSPGFHVKTGISVSVDVNNLDTHVHST